MHVFRELELRPLADLSADLLQTSLDLLQTSLLTLGPLADLYPDLYARPLCLTSLRPPWLTGPRGQEVKEVREVQEVRRSRRSREEVQEVREVQEVQRGPKIRIAYYHRCIAGAVCRCGPQMRIANADRGCISPSMRVADAYRGYASRMRIADEYRR